MGERRDADARTDGETPEVRRLAGPPGHWGDSRDFQVSFLRGEGLRTTDRFLDIGCGPLRSGLPVLSFLDPDRYVGVDVRSEVIAVGERRIDEAGLRGRRPLLVCSATFGEGVLDGRTFDVVWCYQVAIHLEDRFLAPLFRRVAASLDAAGRAFVTVAVDREPGKWLEFPVLGRPLATYAALAAAEGLRTDDLGSLASLGYRGPEEPGRCRMLRFVRAA